MGDALRKRILTDRFQSPAHEAVLNLFVASGHLRDQTEAVCHKFGLTQPLYNVLRILKGGSEEGYSRGDIARRLLDRAPDVTRLLDRLESKGLVTRKRSQGDRRRSVNRITKAGIDLLEQMYPGINAVSDYAAARLSDEECLLLSKLCEEIYRDQD